MMRFSIRDLLWLTVLAAVGVAWWIDHVKTRIDWAYVRKTEQEARAAKERLHWAEMQTKTARERATNVLTAAARFGISPLDVEPETKVRTDLVRER